MTPEIQGALFDKGTNATQLGGIERINGLTHEVVGDVRKTIVTGSPIELDNNRELLQSLYDCNHKHLAKVLQDYYGNISTGFARKEDEIADFTAFVNRLVELDEEKLNSFNSYCLDQMQETLSGGTYFELSQRLISDMNEMLMKKHLN